MEEMKNIWRDIKYWYFEQAGMQVVAIIVIASVLFLCGAIVGVTI